MSISVTMRIETNSDGEFVAAPAQENIDTSFNHRDNAQGALRWQGVANGRYERKHPIFNDSGEQYGVLVKALSELGYTYHCVYSDWAGRFAVSHVTFGAAQASGASCISSVNETGPILFGGGKRKFQRTEVQTFPNGWVGSEQVFKLLEGGHKLLVVSAFGFCIIHMGFFELASKTLFGFDYETNFKGCAVSPNNRLVAAAFSVHDYTDPISGEEKYKNFVRVYDLGSGAQYGELPMDSDAYRYEKWNGAFDESGHRFQFSSNAEKFGFVLETKKS